MKASFDIQDWNQFLKEIGDATLSAEALMEAQENAVSVFQELESQLQKELDENLDATLPEGFVVGKFQILSEIGRGGMSSVYLARRSDGLFEQQVAIKILSPDLLSDKHKSYFDTERKILARLNHPNISKILDGGLIEGGIPYLVMEYVEGISLEDYLDVNSITLSQGISIFQKICEAVRHAHGQLILHRDLKPSNVYVDEEGAIKLLDFGIGGFIDETKNSYTEGGTIRYLPPEHFEQQEYAVQSDIYQMGLLAYRIFEGKHAISGDDPDKVIQNSKEGAIEKWNVLKSNARLKAILNKCLQLDLEDRYVSVDALMIDLKFYLEEKPISALPTNWGNNALLFFKRNKLIASSAFLIFSLAVTFAIWSNVQSQRIEEEKQRALVANQFLTNIFEANDPSLSNGEKISALTLLENAEAQLDRLESIEIKADIMKQLGSLYSSLGEYSQSIEYAQKAADLFQLHKLSEIGYVESLLVMARSHGLSGDKHKSDSVLNEAIEILTPRKTTYPYLFSDLLLESVGSSILEGDFQKGDSIVNLALQLLSDKSKGKFSSEYRSTYESPEVLEAHLYCKKSEIAIYTSRHDEALDAALIAQKLMDKANPMSYKDAMDPSFYVAMSYYAMGEFEKQKEILEDVIEQDLKVYGAEHPMTWQSLRIIANSYNSLGQYKKSDSVLNFLLPRFKTFYGKTNQYTTNVAFFAARSQMSQGNYGEAKKQFLDVLNDYTELPDSENFAVAYAVGTIYENLGAIETALGNYTTAESYLEKCREKYVTLLDESNVRFVALYRIFGNLFRASGQYEKALDYYNRSLTLSEKVFGESHPMHQLIEEEKAKLLTKMGG